MKIVNVMLERSVLREAMHVTVKEQNVQHLSAEAEKSKALGKSGD